MYVYPSNTCKIHYYDNIMYINTNDNLIKKLNSEQSLLMNCLIKKSYDYNNIVDEIARKLNINEKRGAIYKTSQIITSLKGCVEISFNKKDFIKTPLVTGMFNKCYPEDIQIALTSRCLHNCPHCYMNATYHGTDIKLEYLDELLQYVEGYTSTIELTGGEAFLYKDLEYILEKYDGKFEFIVTTSGYWGKTVSVETLKHFSLIQLTLYGYSKEEHNNFVGVKNSFDNVIHNIHYIMNNNINLIVQTQARTDDIESLRKFIDRCINEGIANIMIGEIVPIGRAKNLNIFPSYNRSLIEKNIKLLKNEYKDKINIIFDNEQHNNIEQKFNFFKCGAGKLKWYITENGIIIPCALLKDNLFSMGNIYNRDFIKLVESKEVFNNIEDKWFANYSHIIESYKNNGENFNEICQNIY